MGDGIKWPCLFVVVIPLRSPLHILGPVFSPWHLNESQNQERSRFMAHHAARFVQACSDGDLVLVTELLDCQHPETLLTAEVDVSVHLGRHSNYTRRRNSVAAAAATGRIDVLRLLLERGADPAQTFNGNNFPLQIACQVFPLAPVPLPVDLTPMALPVPGRFSEGCSNADPR